MNYHKLNDNIAIECMTFNDDSVDENDKNEVNNENESPANIY